MEVAQALQQAHAPPEAEVPIKGSVAPQRVEHAPQMEKRKSNFDKYVLFVMPPLVEERVLLARSVSPEPEAKFGETEADLVSPESEMPYATMPGQKDDIFEICG